MNEKLKQTGLNCLGLVLGVVVIVLFIWGGMSYQAKREAKEPWIGTLYRVTGEDRNLREDDRFTDLEACRTWAFDRAEHFGWNEGEWDYSCGTGCSFTGDTISGGREIHEYGCTTITK